MARLYDLEMLNNQNGFQASTYMQLGEVKRRYPLNYHVMARLGIDIEFREPVDYDIPIAEEHVHIRSYVESDSDDFPMIVPLNRTK